MCSSDLLAAAAAGASLAAGLAGPTRAQASEVGFERGSPRSGEGVAATRPRLIVLEFQDPQKTGLGRGVAALVFKDVFTAFGEQADHAVEIRLATGLPVDLHAVAGRRPDVLVGMRIAVVEHDVGTEFEIGRAHV